MILYSLFFLIGLLFGYCCGKHKGVQQGREEGKTETVLDLRQKSLEEGICFLCNHCSVQEPARPCSQYEE